MRIYVHIWDLQPHLDFISGNRLNVRPEREHGLLVDARANLDTARN